MIRGVLRFLGFWVFAAALVAAVLDGVSSIAASAVMISTVAETWAAVAPGSLTEFQAVFVEQLGQPWLWEFFSTWILGAPTALALGVVGFLLMAAGRKPRRDLFAREYAV